MTSLSDIFKLRPSPGPAARGDDRREFTHGPIGGPSAATGTSAPRAAPDAPASTSFLPAKQPTSSSALALSAPRPSDGAAQQTLIEGAALRVAQSPPHYFAGNEPDEDSAFEDDAMSIFSGLSESDEMLISGSPLGEAGGVARELGELLWNVQSELPPGVLQQADTSIRMQLPLSNLSAQVREALQLVRAERIVVDIDFEQGLSRSSPRPRVTVSRDVDLLSAQVAAQMDGATRAAYQDSQTHLLPITMLLTQSLSKLLDERWSRSKETLFPALYQRATLRLEDAGTCCMLCDTTLVYGGLAPSICDAPLCAYQLDSLGLGANLELLRDQPEVASYLFACAMTAASVATRRPLAFPSQALPVDDAYEPIEPAQILALLGKLPDLNALPRSSVGIARALKQIDPLLPKVVAWILATNRAHLVHVDSSPAKEKLNASLQLDIHTSTRAHAAAFAAQKQKYGSFYAFHGSSMGNWHNILRNNLLNVSRTEFMTTGAAYGDGIYLASASSTSLSYAKRESLLKFDLWTSSDEAPREGLWEESIFAGVPTCMALCEVANDPAIINTNSGIFVVPDERNVMLRQLFVNVKLRNAKDLPVDVLAVDLAPRKYRNEATFDGDPIESIPKEHFLATSDGYAWDISELVQWVQAKDGVFLNTYSKKMFAPADVESIIRHPSGQGAPLKALILSNKLLRKEIRAETLAQLRKCGSICVKDQSSDFAPSMRAIDSLKSYLDTVTPREQEALRRVPFETRDSVNRRPVSDTVMHALDSAISEAECIHRFGDFLSQVA